MALPPKDIPPSELFLKLQERPAPSEVVETSIGRVRVVVLRHEQTTAAKVHARKAARDKLQLSEEDLRGGYGEAMLGDLVAREVIAASMFLPDAIRGTESDATVVYPRVFRDASDVGKLTDDEVTELWGFYTLTQRKLGPHEANLTDDEVNAWVRRLVEGGSALPLARLASHQLADLCISLAARASSLSQALTCQPESLPRYLGSLPETWAFGTSSSIEPPANSIPQTERIITAEDARAKALELKERLGG